MNSKSTAAAACAVAGAVLMWTLGRRSASISDSKITALTHVQEPVSSSSSLTTADRRDERAQRGSAGRRASSWASLIVATSSGVGSAAVALSGHALLAQILVLLSMAICALTLRGPERLTGLFVTISLSILLSAEVLVSGAAILQGFDSSTSALYLLQLTIFSILALGIIVCLGATWSSAWDFTEPVAIGLVALSLGALCVPGLYYLSQEIYSPYLTGSALLFTTGVPSQNVALYASASGIGGEEAFQVSNLSKKPVRWALLVAGAARVLDYQLTPRSGAATANLIASGSGLNSDQNDVDAQLFSGNLSGNGSSLSISGTSAGSFADSTTDRTAVALPDFGQGLLSEVSSKTGNEIIRVLGSIPIFRPPPDFTAYISSGPLFPLDSVTSVSLAPTQDPDNQRNLEWTIHGSAQINYSTVNQGSADSDSNLLFVFAVLLGVAGASVLASLQSAIHVFRERSAKNGK